MSFVLTINDENHNENSSVIKNPISTDFESAIHILKQNPENFIILESNPPIDTFTFIQVSDFENSAFHAEVQYEENNALYMYYCDTLSESELLEMLLNFISNIAPNINNWEYLDDFGDYKFYKEYELRKFLKSNGLIALKSKNVPENKIRLDTADIQIFLKHIKENNIKTIFYCYSCANKDVFDVSNIRNGRDNDLLEIAKNEINEYVNKIEKIDFGQSAILELFCIDNGVTISMQITAPWLEILMPASKFFARLKEKYERDLTKIKLNRSNEKDAILEELRTVLLNNSEFALCTNQNLRRDFIRRFLMMKGNEQYRQAFLGNDGYINLYEAQSFVDMTYAVYKQKKHN